MSDPVADFLTRIRNAAQRRHAQLQCQGSLIRQEIAEVLKREGFIQHWEATHSEDGKPLLNVSLKFDKQGASAIRGIKRISTPGLRRYRGYRELKQVWNGQGIAILTTSKGVFTDAQCREQKLGGEVICEVW